ncbi:DUF1919 domain-containing protein [Vibrio lentus]
MIKRISLYFYRNTLFRFFRFFKKNRYRKLVSKKDITIISSNCLAGCIYSDLDKVFSSPTINLFFYAPCFIKFCETIDHYLELDLIECYKSKYDQAIIGKYPVGLLGDIEIHFLHYSSFSDAKISWNARKERVNRENIVFMMTDRDGFDLSIGKRFDALPGRNNVLFSAKKYPDLSSSLFCSGESKIISDDFTSFRKYERYMNIVNWYNNEK